MCNDNSQNIMSMDIAECEQSFDACDLRILLENCHDTDRDCISEIIDMYDKGSIDIDQTLLKILAVYCDFCKK